jgi:4-diphosphocytidyl-2-C-methyl-D-erythritol kinase
VEGPFAAELAGDGNLVVRARDALLAAFPDERAPFRITLEKNLPVASGLGGGSSDAAAALNLMAAALLLGDDGQAAGERIRAIARQLGSDVPACYGGVPVIATGRGDDCDRPPPFPDLDAVLVNPLVAAPTGAVYRAYDAAGAPGSAEPPPWPASMRTPQALAEFLADARNDLQAPAVSLAPAIGDVLAALEAGPQTLLARMSGSGASCFAICADQADARDLALAVSGAHPDWWVRACRLAGFRP